MCIYYWIKSTVLEYTIKKKGFDFVENNNNKKTKTKQNEKALGTLDIIIRPILHCFQWERMSQEWHQNAPIFRSISVFPEWSR